MDHYYDSSGTFTIPAEVSIKLLPQSAQRTLHHHTDARLESLKSSAQSSDNHERLPSRRRSLHRIATAQTIPGEWPHEATNTHRGLSPASVAGTVHPSSSISNTTSAPREMFETDQNDYDIIKPLQRHRTRHESHRLYLIEDMKTKDLYVQKRLRMTYAHDRQRALRERDALWQISKHAKSSLHVVQIFEAFYDGESEYSYVVLEHCDHGTLQDFIHRYIMERKEVPEKFVWHVLEGLAGALMMCHFGISDPNSADAIDGGCGGNAWRTLWHLNVKPANIWLTSRNKFGDFPRVVLSGFEMVVFEGDAGARRAHEHVATGGALAWMPPEAVDASGHEEGVFGMATDVWQLGAVMQALCLLLEVPDMAIVDAGVEPCSKGFTAALNNIVACCMQRGAARRPTSMELARKVQQERSSCSRRSERASKASSSWSAIDRDIRARREMLGQR